MGSTIWGAPNPKCKIQAGLKHCICKWGILMLSPHFLTLKTLPFFFVTICPFGHLFLLLVPSHSSSHNLLKDTLQENSKKHHINDTSLVSGTIAPFMHFSLLFPLFRSLTHIPLSRPVTSLFILIFHPLLHTCTRNIQPARHVSFFSLFPDHVIDHLITMCLPHGFVVTDPIAPSQSVPFVGFHVCPLLETVRTTQRMTQSMLVLRAPFLRGRTRDRLHTL